MAVMINWLAVVAAAAAQMVLGMLWYGPVFGKSWMKEMGFTVKTMKKMKMTPTASITMGVVTALIMSYVTANFVDLLGVTTFATVLQFAIWIWLGYIATLQFGVVLWENKSVKLFALNAVFWFISLFAMTWIHAAWV